jgi:trk system potassium uptake protein TrkA
VALLQLPLHEAWFGHSVRDLEQASGSRVAFIMRFGTGVLPDSKTVLQSDDVVFVTARSGTVSDVTDVATHAPEEEK